MKRDMDLIRGLLLFFEEKEDDGLIEAPAMLGHAAKVVEYHFVLLYQAGFLNCEVYRTESGRISWIRASELTWDGHEFAATIRNDTVWNRAKQVVKDKALGLSVSAPGTA